MSALRNEPEFVLSTLDRLIDHEPEVIDESRPRWVGTIEEIKDSVRSNLTWVLNSRRCLIELPAGRNHLQSSLLAYGLPDFTHVSVGTTEERELLRAAIESAIRRCEPRLTRVVVSRPEADPSGEKLRFQADAILNVKPAPEAVTFDSVLLVPSRTFQMRG
jgi:type VI secretion system protein ImpF